METEQTYIVRCDRAGVFFGQIKERTHNEVTLTNARKIWFWSGAAAVEQLAMTGPKRPNDCKITMEVPEMIVMDPVQIIPCTQEAAEVIRQTAVWKRT